MICPRDDLEVSEGNRGLGGLVEVLAVSTNPRFVSEGDSRTSRPRSGSRRFNPTPASSARGTGPSACRALRPAVSTHPPLRQRGEPLASHRIVAGLFPSRMPSPGACLPRAGPVATSPHRSGRAAHPRATIPAGHSRNCSTARRVVRPCRRRRPSPPRNWAGTRTDGYAFGRIPCGSTGRSGGSSLARPARDLRRPPHWAEGSQGLGFTPSELTSSRGPAVPAAASELGTALFEGRGGFRLETGAPDPPFGHPHRGVRDEG